MPKWNAKRSQPDGLRELLGVRIATCGTLSQLDSYGRKGFSSDSLDKADGEEVLCDFFSLRDLWTAPDGAHFDARVDGFVAIYYFYLTAVGVDGLRIDTVKHIHPLFWDAFTARNRRWTSISASMPASVSVTRVAYLAHLRHWKNPWEPARCRTQTTAHCTIPIPARMD